MWPKRRTAREYPACSSQPPPSRCRLVMSATGQHYQRMAAMKFSVRFNNDLPAERFVRMAARAEEVGFDQIWVSNDLFWQSAPVLVAAAAQATSRIALGVGVFNPVSMHPAEIAMAASSLQDVSGCRLLTPGLHAPRRDRDGSVLFTGRLGRALLRRPGGRRRRVSELGGF